ncbi:Unknown protein sequence [Pseudomonas syringae pv. maculicola]|nr:Unknown protein sequence [Pseudomonas syringae pv. maculicola]
MAVAVSRKKPENVHDKSLGVISSMKLTGPTVGVQTVCQQRSRWAIYRTSCLFRKRSLNHIFRP